MNNTCREIHFEKGPIVSSLLIYCVPILLSQLLQQIYNITDCIIVGNYCGQYGLAAVGLAGLILSVMINFFIGFSTGTGIMVAQEFGAYHYDCLKKIICTIINMGIVLGLILTGLGWILSGNLLEWIHCPAEMKEVTRLYLSTCFLGLMPQLVYNICNATLRALGDTRSSLYYILVSTGINLVLDLILVLGMDMGLVGAALATVLSQWILLAMVIIRVRQMDPSYSYEFAGPTLSLQALLAILNLSLPSGMQAVFMSISSLILQISINQFGAAAVAGMTVYAKLEGFLYYPAFSYGIALTGFIGQNYGAHCIERVKKSVHVSLILPTAIILVLSMILVLSAKPLLGFFTSDPAILQNGYQAILWNFPFYFIYMINQIYLGALKGLGRTKFPMVCTLVCYCLIRVIWCKILIPLFPSMIIVYTSYDISWIIMILMLLPYFKNALSKAWSETNPAQVY